ncbi:hypothetical protein ABE28_020300 [Peribacillus muralis]|uniref:Uncharacterized protein n=1 Tax=Peribacillus muralis TaxID=264697 RepID=A0A1B3XU21_9BACI|nr:hypothetical protein ABE28_020300 [Peribacillus muralis]
MTLLIFIVAPPSNKYCKAILYLWKHSELIYKKNIFAAFLHAKKDRQAGDPLIMVELTVKTFTL